MMRHAIEKNGFIDSKIKIPADDHASVGILFFPVHQPSPAD